ncbi:hypothetical protein [uncultured Massilia sp.]|uniref:hypothetical protein n=1 Tax=uncultured Massilia sp. TaxID=169973 RepID=UPI0025EA0E7F|nr:hypothetical protein [uncultured Massilia sp.]
MVARYKTSLEQFTAMLYLIKTQKNLPIGAIVDFQLLLLKKITEAEKAIFRTKSIIKALRLEKANERPTRERSKEISSLIEKFDNKIEYYNYIIYIWKMYGESIAFHFCDKYAIKHFLYDHNYRVKETAGFISGKKGIRAEIKLLKLACQNNVPAILCDLTNTLRHGDVFLLGHNDPYPIEVKTSNNFDKRGEKQLRNINELNKFFFEDKAEDFRGIGPVFRSEYFGKERCHLEAINYCISKSYEEGTSHISPESGIHYIAATKFKREVFDQFKAKHVHIINLNEHKRAMNWHPYTPFQLSLNPEHLFNFIAGHFTIFILLDLQIIKRRFKKNGLHIIFLQDNNWYAQITASGNILEGGL